MQKRTTIERERILTDRIAEVLIGRNDFTQRIEDETEHNSNAEEKIIIKNPFLQRLRQTVSIFSNLKEFKVFNSRMYTYIILFTSYSIYYIKYFLSSFLRKILYGIEQN